MQCGAILYYGIERITDNPPLADLRQITDNLIMADSNFKIKPVKQGNKLVLSIECRNSSGTWKSAGVLQPKVIASAQNTLKLDIFTPKVEWHDFIKKGRSIILTGSDGIARIKTGVFFHSRDILRVETRIGFTRPVSERYFNFVR